MVVESVLGVEGCCYFCCFFVVFGVCYVYVVDCDGCGELMIVVGFVGFDGVLWRGCIYVSGEFLEVGFGIYCGVIVFWVGQQWFCQVEYQFGCCFWIG